MLNAQDWFVEVGQREGVAFGLKIAERLHAEQSEFQHIEIYQTERFGRLMVIDGCVMLTDRDNFVYHEMIVHPALVGHAGPREVVVVGGGDCGSLREVLRHDGVVRATQVEIDERVTRLAEHYFPQLCERNKDPRAELIFGDGIRWMAEAPDQSVDVVIVDSTDPVGPAEGLFNRAFYRQVRRVLRPDGLLVQQSESPLLNLSLLQEMHAAMRDAGFADSRLLHFPQPVYPSGWWSASLAAPTGRVPVQPRSAVAAEAVTGRYYSASTHTAAFALPPFVETALGSGAGPAVG